MGKKLITVRSLQREKSKRRKAWIKDERPATADHERPQTRADCADVPRPCPFVGCRYNLALEVTAAGSIRLFVDMEQDHDDRPSCALDVAADGRLGYGDIAPLFGVSSNWMAREGDAALEQLRSAEEIRDAPGWAALPEVEYS